MFDAVAFAGGGNRCYWQGGFWEAAAPLLGLKPGMVVGVSAGYCFNVFMQDGTPGAYLASFTALAQLPDVWVGMVKALVFGLIAAIVAAHKGMNAGGGPNGRGAAERDAGGVQPVLELHSRP